MAEDIPPKRKRRRGVILAETGFNRLQLAKQEAEYRENRGNRFTLEKLSEITGLGVDTLMKVFAREVGVDKQTLKQCFQAFNLTLSPTDYYRPSLDTEIGIRTDSEVPEGLVPLTSPYYIERGTIERDCYRVVLEPGSLIRIKAPKCMGKTSLVIRLLARARQHDIHGVYSSLQLSETHIFEDLDRFLKWFCAHITLEVGLPLKLQDYWDELFGSKMSCSLYLEQYILKSLAGPLVIALDDIDRLFYYPNVAEDFFGLLRSWHEAAKQESIWQKLNLIVVHSCSTELYPPINIHNSPFNVGFAVELPCFNLEQALELGNRYGLSSRVEIGKLNEFVGGNPYLLRLALYHLEQGNCTPGDIFSISLNSRNNIYIHHLQRQLWNIHHLDERSIGAFSAVINATGPIEIELTSAFQLQSLGLVGMRGGFVTVGCPLYRNYFGEYFQKSTLLGIQQKLKDNL